MSLHGRRRGWRTSHPDSISAVSGDTEFPVLSFSAVTGSTLIQGPGETQALACNVVDWDGRTKSCGEGRREEGGGREGLWRTRTALFSGRRKRWISHETKEMEREMKIDNTAQGAIHRI